MKKQSTYTQAHAEIVPSNHHPRIYGLQDYGRIHVMIDRLAKKLHDKIVVVVQSFPR